MSVKRLIICALLAQIVALPIIALEARHMFMPRETKPAIVSTSAYKVPETVGLGQNSPTTVKLVAQKLSRQKSKETSPSTYERYINKTAMNHGVSPALVKAVIQAESDFRPQAISQKGAIGLMQVMPSTAETVSARHLFNPRYNIQVGVRYLKQLLKTFDGDEKLAVAAYNSGPRKVKKYGGVPPYKETRVYVKRVLSYYRSF